MICSTAQGLTGVDPVTSPVVDSEPAQMGESPTRCQRGHGRPAGFGILQIPVGTVHPNRPQMSQWRRIQVASECGLQTARAEPSGYGDLVERDRLTRVLIDE